MENFKDFVIKKGDKMNDYGVNLWDDYYDDETGKPQKTYMYVEEFEIRDEVKGKIMEVVFSFMVKNLDMSGVDTDYEIGDDRFNIDNLTHKRREEWMDILSNAKLEFSGTPIVIYSES